MQPNRRPKHQGIYVRHQRVCGSNENKRCNCKPRYEASAWIARDNKRVTRSFASFDEAKNWRQDAQRAARRGGLRAASSRTLAEAAQEWLAGVRAGLIRNRSGDLYKPSAIRGYEQSLRIWVLPNLGQAKLGELDRAKLQRFVALLLAEGLSASSIRNALLPVRAIYRHAVAHGELDVNPTIGLQLPAVRGSRDRIASPEEGAALLAALPVEDRPVWATAMYAGLRLGELLALRWEDIDFKAGVIRVRWSWDPKEGFVEPKSRAGRRSVPLTPILRRHLQKHRLRIGRSSGLVFGRSVKRPFNSTTPINRAKRAWKKADLAPIGFHECRHTFASLMIAAGVNAKALSVFMGHSSITITLDLYGHLFPGSEDEAAKLLDEYLRRSIRRQQRRRGSG